MTRMGYIPEGLTWGEWIVGRRCSDLSAREDRKRLTSPRRRRVSIHVESEEESGGEFSLDEKQPVKDGKKKVHFEGVPSKSLKGEPKSAMKKSTEKPSKSESSGDESSDCKCSNSDEEVNSKKDDKANKSHKENKQENQQKNKQNN